MRAIGAPERRREECHERRRRESSQDRPPPDARSSGDFAGTLACEPTENAHQHHAQPEDVEHIHSQKIGPGRPGVAERELLHPEKQRQAENLRAASDCRSRNGIARSALRAQSVRHQRKGNPRKKNEQRRRKRSAELRHMEKGRLARFRAQPRVVAVRLKHQHAGQPAHPVNMGQPLALLRHSQSRSLGDPLSALH